MTWRGQGVSFILWSPQGGSLRFCGFDAQPSEAWAYQTNNVHTTTTGDPVCAANLVPVGGEGVEIDPGDYLGPNNALGVLAFEAAPLERITCRARPSARRRADALRFLPRWRDGAVFVACGLGRCMDVPWRMEYGSSRWARRKCPRGRDIPCGGDCHRLCHSRAMTGVAALFEAQV